MHDYSEYDKYIKDLKELEKVSLSGFNINIFHQNLLVVSCGNHLMYGYLDKNPEKETTDDGSLIHYKLKEFPKGDKDNII